MALTLDHILPRSRGGDNSPVNIVTACIKCNNRKSNRTPEEARMPLLTSQSALRVKLERVVLCHYAEARAEWRKYLFMDVHDDRDVMERVHSGATTLRLNNVRQAFLPVCSFNQTRTDRIVCPTTQVGKGGLPPLDDVGNSLTV